MDAITPTPDSPDGNQGTTVKKTPTVDEVVAELEATRKALKQANAEAAERRKKLDAIEAEEAKRNEASMSELDKAKKNAEKLAGENAELGKRLQTIQIQAAIEREASALGFADIQDAFTLVARSEIVIDGDTVKGAKEAVAALAKAKPYLLKSATVAQTGTAGKPSTRTIGTAATTQPVAMGVRF